MERSCKHLQLLISQDYLSSCFLTPSRSPHIVVADAYQSLLCPYNTTTINGTVQTLSIHPIFKDPWAHEGSDVIVESNHLKPSTYQDKSRIELLRYSKVYSPDNHICNAVAWECPSHYTVKQHSDIITLMRWTSDSYSNKCAFGSQPASLILRHTFRLFHFSK